MDGRLAEAIELVVHDLDAAAGLPFALSQASPLSDRNPDDRNPDYVYLLFEIGVGGAGLRVWPEGTLAEQLGDLLEVIQQEVLEARAEAGLWAYWPRSPGTRAAIHSSAPRTQCHVGSARPTAAGPPGTSGRYPAARPHPDRRPASGP